MLDNADVSGSTPRAPQTRAPVDFARLPLAYESLKNELTGSIPNAEVEDATVLPTTPATQRLPDMSMTPSPMDVTTTTGMQSTAQRPAQDKLLHRILDKNYRIKATPLSTRSGKQKLETPLKQASWRDQESPMSSPPVAAPQLRAEYFDSPLRKQFQSYGTPRTPGVSVLPSARKDKTTDMTSRTLFSAQKTKSGKDEITWESDSDDASDPEGVYRELGLSPPKTIQFSLPQSRLLQTPGMCFTKLVSTRVSDSHSARGQQTYC